MQWLKKAGFSIVPLDDAVSETSDQGSALRAVVTFDDGWYSTGAKLLPVMTELRIPSTLYLCTKHFVEAWPVLPVALRYILWKSTQLQAEIAGFDPEVDGHHDLETPDQRDQLASKIFVSIEKFAFDKAAVEAALDRFAACLGVSTAEVGYRNSAFSYMSADELRAASLNGCAIELHGDVHKYPVGDPVRFKADLMVCARVIDELRFTEAETLLLSQRGFRRRRARSAAGTGRRLRHHLRHPAGVAADKAQRYICRASSTAKMSTCWSFRPKSVVFPKSPGAVLASTARRHLRRVSR